MRISSNKLNPSLKKEIEKVLVQTVCDFTNPKETLTFLKDFFNDAELETFAKRLAVAYWLKKGRSYANIKQNLKVSSATVAVIQETLKKPGIKAAVKKIEAEEWANKWTEKIRKLGIRN